tara:strand:- start:856 stop:1038 length:183 start_codon:yes stop_codon:yes gene_type:complete
MISLEILIEEESPQCKRDEIVSLDSFFAEREKINSTKERQKSLLIANLRNNDTTALTGSL